MTEKDEIRHLYNLLQYTSRWYVSPYSPDIIEFQDIVEKAKEWADYSLTKMTIGALWQRYRKWKKSDKFMKPNDDYYESFLNDLVFQLGLSALDKNEKDLYEESCNLTIRFI